MSPNRHAVPTALLLDITERERVPRFHSTFAENLLGAAYRFTIGRGMPVPFADEGIARMTGYPVIEIRGSEPHPIYSLIVRGDRKRVRETIRSALAGMSSFKVEYRVRRRDGQLRHFFDRGQALADGELQQIEGAVFDITEQKLLKGKLQRMQLELQHLSEQLAVAQEVERAAIARELHDGLSQSLVGIQIRLGTLLNRDAKGDSEPRAAELVELLSIVQSASEELQRVSAGLRPAILDDLGLLPALVWLCREFRAICPDLDLSLDVQVGASEIPQAIATTIYRIVQEGLSNTFKHARATKVVVVLAHPGKTIVLEIADNGSGFDPRAAIANGAASDAKHSFGLRSIRQRAVLSGGELSVRSNPANGTALRVEWPSDR